MRFYKPIIKIPEYSGKRKDCHVHLSKLYSARGTLMYESPTIKELEDYQKKDNLDCIVGIYKTDFILESYFKIETALEILPFQWIINPKDFEISKYAQGIKLHPFVNSKNYESGRLTSKNIENVLEKAKLNKIKAILIHTDAFDPKKADLEVIESLAEKYHKLNFIIGHSGDYSSGSKLEIFKEQIFNAVCLANDYPNIYLDTTVLNSEEKTKILAENLKAPNHKLLIGTDFPIDKEVSLKGQEAILQDAFSKTNKKLNLSFIYENILRVVYNW